MSKIKNWSKFTSSGFNGKTNSCWRLVKEPANKKKYVYRICIRWLSGMKEWKIDTAYRVKGKGMKSGLYKGSMGYNKSFSPLYKKVINWLKTHPNG